MRPGDDVPGCDAMARTSDQGPPSTARRPGSGPGAAAVAASGQAASGSGSESLSQQLRAQDVCTQPRILKSK